MNSGSFQDTSRYTLDPAAAVRMGLQEDFISVDIETAGLDERAYNLKAVSIGNADGTDVVVLDAKSGIHRQAIKDTLKIAQEIHMHGSPFDAPLLVHHDLMPLDQCDVVVDTAVTARMAWPGVMVSKRLEDLEEKLLRTAIKDRFTKMSKIHGVKKKDAFNTFGYDDPSYRMYSGWDSIITSRISPMVYDAAIQRLTDHPFGRYGSDKENAQYIIEREQRINRLFLRRSAQGLGIDSILVDREIARYYGIMNESIQELERWGIFRPTNPTDLMTVISSLLPLNYPRTKKTGKPSTSAEHLERINHRAAKAFVQYKKAARLLNYLEQASTIAGYTGGRVQPQVGILVAVTGRMSYAVPPLQQFPDESRGCICADEELTSLDWTQIEIVTPANMARDQKLLDAFELGNGDMHQTIADMVGIPRQDAKNCVFAELYVVGVKKLAAMLGDIPPKDVHKMQSTVRKAMPRTIGLLDKAVELAVQHGCIFTLSGRIIPIDDKRFSYRAGNYLSQGSAYDVLAETLHEIYIRGMADSVYIAMHDEIVASKSAADEIKEIMEKPFPRMVEICRRTPVLRVDKVDIGNHWRKG